MGKPDKTKANKNEKKLDVPSMADVHTKSEEKDSHNGTDNTKCVKKEKPFRFLEWFRGRGFTDWVMVAITGFLAYYTYQLVNTAIIQSNAAIDALDISRQIGELNERTARIIARAYVIAHSPTPSELVVGKEFKVNYIVENTGSTPAYQFAVFSKMDFVDLFPNQVIDWDGLGSFMQGEWVKAPKGYATLAARASNGGFDSIPAGRMTEMNIFRMGIGQVALVLRIGVSYRDAWGEYHISESRFIYHPYPPNPGFRYYIDLEKK